VATKVAKAATRTATETGIDGISNNQPARTKAAIATGCDKVATNEGGAKTATGKDEDSNSN